MSRRFRRFEESHGGRPVLEIADVMMSFEVETDASDFALGRGEGGVLLQDSHPIAYDSLKLNVAEQAMLPLRKKS